jgi:hypothetical protein
LPGSISSQIRVAANSRWAHTVAPIWGIIRHLIAAGLVTLGDKGYHGAGYFKHVGNLRKCSVCGIHSHGVLADFKFSPGNACINQ